MTFSGKTWAEIRAENISARDRFFEELKLNEAKLNFENSITSDFFERTSLFSESFTETAPSESFYSKDDAGIGSENSFGNKSLPKTPLSSKNPSPEPTPNRILSRPTFSTSVYPISESLPSIDEEEIYDFLQEPAPLPYSKNCKYGHHEFKNRYKKTEFTVNVFKSEILTLGVNPRTDCLLVAAGDKNGHVTLWKKSLELSYYSSLDVPRLLRLKFGKSCIKQVSFSSGNSDVMYVVSKQGRVREVDLREEKFSVVYCTNSVGQSTPLKCFTEMQPGVLLVGDKKGYISVVDTRDSSGSRSHCCLTDSLRTLSTDPDAPSVFASASHSVQLWDLRTLSTCDSAQSCVSTVRLAQRPLSAHFSSRGGKLLVTTPQSVLCHVPSSGGTKFTLEREKKRPWEIGSVWHPSEPSQLVCGWSSGLQVCQEVTEPPGSSESLQSRDPKGRFTPSKTPVWTCEPLPPFFLPYPRGADNRVDSLTVAQFHPALQILVAGTRLGRILAIL